MKLVIDIKVADLERAKNFYVNSLGLTCRRTESDWAAVQVGDAELHLFLHGGATENVEFYVDDIDTKVDDLIKRGVTFVSGSEKKNCVSVDDKNITTFPWGRAAFFKDTEGNELAIVQDF